LVIITSLFSSFIRPSTFVCALSVRVIRRIIASVESSDITFHSLANVLALNMVHKTVCVYVHNFTFVAKQWTYTSEIRVRLSICWVYSRKSTCWTSSQVCAVWRRSNFPQRCYGCRNSFFAIVVFAPYHPSHFVNNFTSTWFRTFSILLPNIAFFINLHKFFSCFARVLKSVLSGTREAMEIAWMVVFDESLLREVRDEYIAADYSDVVT